MVHLQTKTPKKKKKKKKKWKLISDYLLGKNNITKMWVLNTFY